MTDTATQTWISVTVDFTVRPEVKDSIAQGLNFIVSAYSEKVHRPGCYERVEYMDGTWNYRYEVTVIPEKGWDADSFGHDVSSALVAEGLTHTMQQMRVNGKRVQP